MELNHILEYSAVALSIAYVVLIAREKRVGWWFGIVGSALSIWLFFRVNLKAEAVLYFYYVAAGIYGWWVWGIRGKSDKGELQVHTMSPSGHMLLIIFGAGAVWLLGVFMREWGSAYPFFDSATTVFSFIATWMATRKILENWIYWIVIDLASVYLYHLRGLDVYALLMVVFTVLAVYGFREWKLHIGRNAEKLT